MKQADWCKLIMFKKRLSSEIDIWDSSNPENCYGTRIFYDRIKYNLKDWKAYMKEAESKFHFFQTGKVFLLSKKEKIGDDPKPSSRCLHSHDGQDFTTRPACLSVSKHEWKRTANLGEMRNLGTSCRKIWQRVVKSGEAMKGSVF